MVFLRYRIGGLIFGGDYTWRGLFSEFYGNCFTVNENWKGRHGLKRAVDSGLWTLDSGLWLERYTSLDWLWFLRVCTVPQMILKMDSK